MIRRSGDDRIAAVEWVNSELAPERARDKGIRLDVYVVTDRSEHVNIEIQVDLMVVPSTKRHHSSYHIYEDQEQFPLSGALAIHFVELPKLRQAARGKIGVLARQPLERWLLLLEASKSDDIQNELEGVAMSDPVDDRDHQDST